MSTPIEERAFRWILQHRRLKRFLVLVALLGIISSAIEATLDLVKVLGSTAIYIFEMRPAGEIRGRYLCVFKFGDLREYANQILSAPAASDSTKSSNVKFEADYISSSLDEYSKCGAVYHGDFKFSDELLVELDRIGRGGTSDAEPAFLDKVLRLLDNRLHTFEGHLEGVDPTAYKFYVLGSDIAQLNRLLERSIDEGRPYDGKPGEQEQQIAHRINESLRDLTLPYPYRTSFPQVGVRDTSTLYNSLKFLNEQIESYLGP